MFRSPFLHMKIYNNLIKIFTRTSEHFLNLSSKNKNLARAHLLL